MNHEKFLKIKLKINWEELQQLKTVAFIASKKIQQSKKKLFVVPLKISLKTSVCMH